MPPVAVSTEAVVRAYRQKALSRLTVRFFEELFSITWELSHLRWLEVAAFGETDLAGLMSFAFRTASDFEFQADEWLPQTDLEICSQADLFEHIQSCLANLGTPDTPTKLTLQQRLLAIDLDEATPIYRILPHVRCTLPNSPHRYGRTDICCWLEQDIFYYLELHMES